VQEDKLRSQMLTQVQILKSAINYSWSYGFIFSISGKHIFLMYRLFSIKRML